MLYIICVRSSACTYNVRNMLAIMGVCLARKRWSFKSQRAGPCLAYTTVVGIAYQNVTYTMCAILYTIYCITIYYILYASHQHATNF